MPKSTESRANERAERFFIDITGPFHVTSLGGNRYAMLCVDDFTHFKFIRFLKHKSAAAGVRNGPRLGWSVRSSGFPLCGSHGNPEDRCLVNSRSREGGVLG